MDQSLPSSSLNLVPFAKFKEKVALVIHSCPTCSTITHISSEKAIDGVCHKCALLVTLLNRYYGSNIPVEYWGLSMEKDFVGDQGLKTKYQILTEDMAALYCLGKSVCFAGGHGSGKTFVTTSILKKACQKGYSCLYTDMYSVVSTLTQAGNEDKFLARRQLTLTSFLVLDELDARFSNQSDAASNLFARTLESIIRTRLQNQLPTFMATNSPNIKESFQSLFKDSLGSLWNKIEIFTIMPGKDFRQAEVS